MSHSLVVGSEIMFLILNKLIAIVSKNLIAIAVVVSTKSAMVVAKLSKENYSCKGAIF